MLFDTDVLIAATAGEHGLVLCTADVRHYKVIADLSLHAFRPASMRANIAQDCGRKVD